MPGHNHYPDCVCGWCNGGGGGSGTSFPSGHFTSQYRDDDFCQPTTCTKCGAQIYFVRHNGGSVSFDSLGPPWPQHPCFADDAYGIQLRRELKERPRVVFGVIMETKATVPGMMGRMVIRCNDGSIIDEHVSSKLDLSRLPGKLVIVCRDENGELSIRIIREAERTLAKFFQITEISTGRIVIQYIFPRKAEAYQHLQALEAEQPGKHRIEEVNLWAYLEQHTA